MKIRSLTSKFQGALAALAVAALFVAPSSAFAQGNTGQSTTGVSRGNGLRIPQYRTVGSATTTTYFVDPTGNDANACTASGTDACLTIQAALNKIPKLLRNQVTVQIAAGTYAGFLVSGFYEDVGIQQTTGGLLINGALANSTLATGSATGTATGGTAGSGSTFGTLVNAGAGWTVNDLVGRIITTATPTNTEFVIVSNTATTATIAGTWSAPTGATTYTIQDPSVIINTAVSFPANPTQAAAANRAAILLLNNNITYRDSAISLRYLRTSNTSGNGIEISDNSAYIFTDVQLRPTAATAIAFQLGAASAGATGSVLITKSDLFPTTSSNPGVLITTGSISFTNALVRGVSTTNPSINVGSTGIAAIGRLRQLQNSQISGNQSGVLVGSGNPSLTTWTGVVIACGTTGGYGLNVGVVASLATRTNPGGVSSLTSTNISGCDTAVRVFGQGAVDITSLSGSATTDLAAIAGGVISFVKATTTITATGNEVSLNNGEVTAAFGDIAAGACITTLSDGSRVCGR